ncbi:hypothetical protein E2C01_011055 [Portunus trituberculatus]|uniref:Uncharacterized protein n=1 Tax=Portunus trituberculatus TaxID=210409 RepID=A0A5B7DAF0_PORTR|nr:hypothetical protein [Portunus trituberculatus]
MTVVVVSYNLAFLVNFAEWSLKDRLLVWTTRLLVVTSLTLPQLQDLLSAHWTYSMMNSVFFNMKNNSSRTKYQVLSYFPYSPTGPQLVQVASWIPSRALVIAETNAFFQEKFSNFHGAQVNVSAAPFPPFWDELKGPDNTRQYRGAGYSLLSTIAAALNFTFRVMPTSSWAEVVRLVEERVAFLSPNSHMVLPHRREHYDFSFVYEYASMDFCMAPPGLQPQWKAFYYPLSWVVWVATLLALLITSFFLFAV